MALNARQTIDLRAAFALTLPRPCPFCELPVTADQEWHLDHARPMAHGGTDEPANLRVAHAHCNTSAGATVRRGTDYPPSRAW